MTGDVYAQRSAPPRLNLRCTPITVLVGVATVVTVLLAGAAISAAAPTGASRSAESHPSSTTANAPASMLRGTGVVRWGTLYPQASGYERFSYVLVSRHDAPAAARLPGTSLVYMSGTSVQRSWSTGVSYQEAVANEWLLMDPDGARIVNTQYAAFVGDIGSRAYQERFVSNVLQFLRSTGVGGVFIDDIVADPLGLTGGVYPAKYPTSEAWEEAVISFVSNVGKALKAHGYYVLANANKYVSGDTRSDTGAHAAAFWRRLAPNVSGLMTEYWLQNPTDPQQLRARGSRWHENWDGWQRLVAVAQGAGADFFGLAYGSVSDQRAMRYTRASFLLDWSGRGGALIYATTDRADPYHPAWVKQLGRPLQSKIELAPGVFRRRYERGWVIVNTTDSPIWAHVGRAQRVIGSTDALFLRALGS